MAAIFALSLVPAGALAAGTNGEMYYDDRYDTNTGAGQGSITVANPITGERYDFYRLFDLASFNDTNPSPGQHDSEAYSYVIQEDSPWYTWLINNKLYNNNGGDSAMAALRTSSSDTPATGQLFWIEPSAITLTDPYGVTQNDYHVITATTNFSTNWDVSGDGTAQNTYKYDEQDYTTTSDSGMMRVKTVQDFAQRALAYAKEQVSGSDRIPANYWEIGPSPTSASNPTPDPLVVNLSSNSGGGEDHGTTKPADGKVYLGWYLMGTSAGALASLDTTNTDVTVYEKTEKPHIEKKVLRKRVEHAGGGNRNAVSDYVSVNDPDELVDVDANSTRWTDNTNADIGDYVMFKTVITTHQGASNYVLHDVMEDGLTFVNGWEADPCNEYIDNRTQSTNGYDYTLKVVHVPYNSTTGKHETPVVIPNQASVAGTPVTNYEIKTSQSDGCDFEIVFHDSKTDDSAYTYANAQGVHTETKDKDKIIVLYWAKVNENAATWGTETEIASSSSNILDQSNNPLPTSHQVTHKQANDNGRNDNYTILTYGASSYTSLERAHVTTYQFDVVKTREASTGDTHNLLAGAKFSVYKANNTATNPRDPALDGDDAKSFVTGGNNSIEYKVTSKRLAFEEVIEGDKKYYRYVGDKNATNAAAATSTILTSSNQYELSLRGLETGTYLIYEDEAPEGFNKLAYPLVVTIIGDNDGDGKVSGEYGYNLDAQGQTITDESNYLFDGSEGKLKLITKGNDVAATSAPSDEATINWEAAVTPGSGSATATYTSGSGATANGGIHVINQTGRELPSTGGMGTTIFYVVGGVLVAGAVILFVTKRRMGTEA